ncbi:ABC transporter substrate-binding protein [Paenibacillus sp. 2TAB19]|uniref:ABC transporter substrate-binding protein n=1 Tax=Paenibacillus sp. 2TAB19 TaxID=3233003 RepID=UPI003F946D4F
MNRKRSLALMVLLCVSIVLSACGSNNETNNAANGTNDGGAEPAALKKITQVTNWFAEAEHGGQYAALQQGFYKEAGLDMTIQSGGPQVSGVQLVASGKAEFAMAHADEVLMARAQGIPVVAIASVLQTNPIAFMYHNENKLAQIEDLSGKTTYILPGQPFWNYILNTRDVKGVKEVAYTGSMANFINDKSSYTQGYVTNESYTLQQEGVDFGSMLIADATGYNPYACMLITTEKYMQENPEIVKAYVDASLKGWNFYKDNYEEVNPFIQTYNPDATLEWLKFGAEAAIDLIWTGDAAEHGVGYMSLERWETLAKQMFEGKVIEKELDASKAFTTEFIS